jgi:hypothetical protein
VKGHVDSRFENSFMNENEEAHIEIAYFMNGTKKLMWVRYADDFLRKLKFYEKHQRRLKGQHSFF